MNSVEETAKQSLPAWMDYASLNASCGIVLEQFRRGQTVHAYLLSGARGLGKATFARVLISALFCVSEHRPCGVCKECRQVLGGTNPDVKTITPEGSKQIGVERVREVIDSISQHAFGAGHRVVVIEPVEKLTPQAQNCLLKSLEEPVSNVIFLLLSHEMTSLLGTVSSRCARVKLTPWPDDAMTRTLNMSGYDPIEIQRVLPLCSGNIGDAIQMLENKQQDPELQSWIHKVLTVSTDGDVVGISTSMKDERENAERYVTAIEQAVHCALMVRTRQLDESALAPYPREWSEVAAIASVEDLIYLMRSIAQTRRLVASQVNWQSNIDHLILRILEERIKWRQLLA